MNHLSIRDTAILIGLDASGVCVYSDGISLAEYWDGEHVWDSDVTTRQLKLVKVKGFLFDETGDMFEEFETIFDAATGLYQSGWSRLSDGTYREHFA